MSTVRLARDEDGPAIGKLFAEAALSDLGVDWHEARVGGWWLVAEADDGRIVGAIQVAAGRPFGFIGDVVVHPSAQGRGEEGGHLGKRPGAVGLALYATALAMMGRAGTQVALGITDKPGLKKMLTRYGGEAQGEFTLFAKRLSP